MELLLDILDENNDWEKIMTEKQSRRKLNGFNCGEFIASSLVDSGRVGFVGFQIVSPYVAFIGDKFINSNCAWLEQ